jgi:hypothetical protein
MSTVNKKWYTLLSGRHIWHNAKGERVIAKPGDSVPLTDEQYQGLKPKFEPTAPTPTTATDGEGGNTK